MLRFVGIVIGMYLAGLGAELAQEEADIIDARFIALARRPTALKVKDFEIERAYLALSGRDNSRLDWRQAELALAVKLDRIGYPNGFVPSPLREMRVKQSAERVARASPMSAEAWCLLALSEAKADDGSRQLLVERLRACFVFGPRESELFETRLHLALATWESLPRDLKIVALSHVASALQGAGRRRMLELLAYGIALIAPVREEMLMSLIEPYGEEVVGGFKKRILFYRKQYGTQASPFQ